MSYYIPLLRQTLSNEDVVVDWDGFVFDVVVCGVIVSSIVIESTASIFCKNLQLRIISWAGFKFLFSQKITNGNNSRPLDNGYTLQYI